MKNRKHLTTSEINNLLMATRGHKHAERDHCLMLMCFIHGLRASEACHLRLSDINLHDKVIYIRRLKNGFSTIHPLAPEEIPHLTCWLNLRDKMRDAHCCDWLFLSQKGGQLTRKHIHYLIRRYGLTANIAITPHPHMLRHACGYALADSGADTRLIQDYLGHRNIRHTVIYTASNPNRFIGLWQKK